jgi:hypothetical protein
MKTKTKLPKEIIRIDDGEVFTLNADGKTYSLEFMKRRFPSHLYSEYTYKVLMENYKGYFRHD